MRFKYKFFVFCLFLIVGSGCASLSSFQGAKTLNPDESQMGFSLNYFVIPINTSGDTSTETKTETITLPSLEFWYRHGLINSLDMGIKMFPFGMLLDFKYQFIALGPFNMAVSAGGDFFMVGFGDERTSFAHIYTPLYISLDAGRKLSVNIIPKNIVTFANSTSIGGYRADDLGVGIGISINSSETFSLIPEVNIYRRVYDSTGIDLDKFPTILYSGLGFAFNF